jgi:hypothetical protein
VPLAVEEDEAPGPIDVAVLGAPGVVAHAEEVPQLVEETGPVPSARGRRRSSASSSGEDGGNNS